MITRKNELNDICIEKINSFDILINNSNQNNVNTRTYSNIDDKSHNSLNLSVSRNFDISNIINFSIPNNTNSSDFIIESIINYKENLTENAKINSEISKKEILVKEKIDCNFIEFFNDLDNTELKMLLKLAEFQKNNNICNKTKLPENLNKRQKISIASNRDSCSNESFVTFTFNEQSLQKMNQLDIDSISITKKHSNNQSIENSFKNEKMNIENSNETIQVFDYNISKDFENKSIKNFEKIPKINKKDKNTQFNNIEKNKRILIKRDLKLNVDNSVNDKNSPDYIKQDMIKKIYSNPNLNVRKAHNLKIIQSDEELSEEENINNEKQYIIQNYMMNPFIYYNNPVDNLFKHNMDYIQQNEEILIKRKKPVIAKSADITKPKRVYK